MISFAVLKRFLPLNLYNCNEILATRSEFIVGFNFTKWECVYYVDNNFKC